MQKRGAFKIAAINGNHFVRAQEPEKFIGENILARLAQKTAAYLFTRRRNTEVPHGAVQSPRGRQFIPQMSQRGGLGEIGCRDFSPKIKI